MISHTLRHKQILELTFVWERLHLWLCVPFCICVFACVPNKLPESRKFLFICWFFAWLRRQFNTNTISHHQFDFFKYNGNSYGNSCKQCEKFYISWLQVDCFATLCDIRNSENLISQLEIVESSPFTCNIANFSLWHNFELFLFRLLTTFRIWKAHLNSYYFLKTLR